METLLHHAARNTGDAGDADADDCGEAGGFGGRVHSGSHTGASVRGSAFGVPGRADLSGMVPGELAWGGPISPEAVRRIACDAGVRRVITDPAGVPLDVGREARTVTSGQFAALVARDGGCAFPGCTRPASWTEAHHIQHWADGGVTSVDNMVLLCGHHHRTVHHRGWDVGLADDRIPEFIPPPWIDPERLPRRNTRPRLHHPRHGRARSGSPRQRSP